MTVTSNIRSNHIDTHSLNLSSNLICTYTKVVLKEALTTILKDIDYSICCYAV